MSANNKSVRVALPHATRSELRTLANGQGTTVNKLILDAIQEKYFNDKQKRGGVAVKYLEMVEKAFPGKDCAIDFWKQHRPYGITYAVTIHVDDCHARRELNKFEMRAYVYGEDARMALEIESLIRMVQGEFEKLKQKRGELNARDSSQEAEGRTGWPTQAIRERSESSSKVHGSNSPADGQVLRDVP